MYLDRYIGTKHSGMSTSDKEWLLGEQEWLDEMDALLLRIYGVDYEEWLAGETDPRAWLEHVVDEPDTYLQAKLAYTKLCNLAPVTLI